MREDKSVRSLHTSPLDYSLFSVVRQDYANSFQCLSLIFHSIKYFFRKKHNSSNTSCSSIIRNAISQANDLTAQSKRTILPSLVELESFPHGTINSWALVTFVERVLRAFENCIEADSELQSLWKALQGLNIYFRSSSQTVWIEFQSRSCSGRHVSQLASKLKVTANNHLQGRLHCEKNCMLNMLGS